MDVITKSYLMRGGEAELVQAFIDGEQAGNHEELLPISKEDTIVREMAFKFGRADIVVFHADGSATVIEAKDGSNGYSHVVAGIGQVGLYAVQLALTKQALTKIRKALMWSSSGNLMADTLIHMACEAAGVIPLPWQSVKSLRDTKAATIAAMTKAAQP